MSIGDAVVADAVLDDPALRDRVDPTGFARLIAGLPAQARAAWELGGAWEPPAGFRRPGRVVALGLGGSAIGADVVATIASRVDAVPVQVVRDYAAPPPGDDTLVVACSFFGNTEEVLAAFAAGIDGPGMRLAITTGGRLGELAGRHRCGLLRYDSPGPPRTALGYCVFPLLAVLERLGALPPAGAAVARAFDGLERGAAEWGLAASHPTNLAKQIAGRIRGRLPVIIGSDALAVAASRWVGNVTENAKQWALSATLPEADHNLVVGFAEPEGVRTQLHVVLLDGAALHPRNRLRVELTVAQLEEAGVSHEVVAVEGEALLDSILRACYLGDWVSYYLALLNGVDPLPTLPLDRLKEQLAQTP